MVDPRISNFSVQIEPVFRQGRETADTEKGKISGNDLDYNIGLGFLQGAKSWFDLNLSTFRTTSANDLAFGSLNRADISATELLFNWKNGWFPLSFLFTTGSYEQNFGRLDGYTSRRDEDRDRYRISGRSSKLQLTLDSEQVDDNVFGRDYALNRALLEHNAPWGRGSALHSSFSAFDRTGFAAYRLLSWNERLRIQHTEALESNSIYRFYSQEADTKQTTHEGSFELRHDLYTNLESSAQLWGRSDQAEVLDRTEYEIGARSNYQKNFFFGALSAGVYANYRLTDRVSKAGQGEAINERYIARFVAPILLREQLIYEATIVVMAEDGFVYAAGIDYETVTFGGAFTELRIIPNGRIRDGDVLLVSYRYELLPSAEYNSVTIGYDFSWLYRWIQLFHNGNQYNHELISGDFPPPDQKYRTTGLELSWDFWSASVRFRGESIYRQNGEFESRSTVLNQSLGFPLSQKFGFSLSGNQAFTDTSGVVTPDPLSDFDLLLNESSSEFYAFDATLTWHPSPGLSIMPALGVWRRNEDSRGETSPNIDRLYYAAELRVSWFVRQLSMDFYYNHNVGDIDGVDSKGDRLFLTLRRRFR